MTELPVACVAAETVIAPPVAVIGPAIVTAVSRPIVAVLPALPIERPVSELRPLALGLTEKLPANVARLKPLAKLVETGCSVNVPVDVTIGSVPLTESVSDWSVTLPVPAEIRESAVASKAAEADPWTVLIVMLWLSDERPANVAVVPIDPLSNKERGYEVDPTPAVALTVIAPPLDEMNVLSVVAPPVLPSSRTPQLLLEPAAPPPVPLTVTVPVPLEVATPPNWRTTPRLYSSAAPPLPPVPVMERLPLAVFTTVFRAVPPPSMATP